MMTDSNLDLPLWFVRMAIPIGGTLFALHFIGSMYALTRGVDPNSKIVS
jgi:C4-dicarboxylate transporter DctQ subunit